MQELLLMTCASRYLDLFFFFIRWRPRAPLPCGAPPAALAAALAMHAAAACGGWRACPRARLLPLRAACTTQP